MKSFKRLFSMMCALCLLAMLFPVEAVNYTGAQDNRLYLSTEDSDILLGKYAREVDLIRAETGVNITSLDAESFEVIKTEAIKNLDNNAYNFSRFVDEVVTKNIDRRFEANTITTFGHDKTQTTYYPAQTLRTFGPVKGDVKKEVATDSSLGGDVSFNIGVMTGEIIKGSKITSGFTLGIKVSISGPSAGAKLPNGLKATHNIPCAVVFGSIVRKQWDTIDVATGKLLHHGDMTIIDGAQIVGYVSMAQIANKVYVESPISNKVSTWATLAAFKSGVKTNPEKYLL